ncbi:MAG: iron-sulfur cluster repair di-iron protein [Actinomycetota bacterium]|nr:iron-sulfur cluster repair di-iron protein [Actinomycetota bacterium]
MLSLGALVEAFPQLAREFERRGFDYCCGGGRSLAQACAAGGLDPAVTAAELAVATGDSRPAEWSGMGAAALCDHLESTHHRYLWDEMPRLSALVAKIESVHGERHPELAEVTSCYEAVRADLEPHLLKEERVLFPMVRDLAAAATSLQFHCGTLRNPISVMLSEHDHVGELLARLRQLTGGYEPPADGCATYVACYQGLAQLEADTHLHIHKENNVLFPMIVRMEAELQGT